MPGPLESQWETMFGTTFAAPPKTHYYGVGDIVWKPAEFSSGLASWTKSKSYRIVDLQYVTYDDAGTERFADSTLDTEVTNAGTQPTDVTSGFFYIIEPTTGTGNQTTRVHESELLNEAAIETYIGTQVAGFIAPPA